MLTPGIPGGTDIITMAPTTAAIYVPTQRLLPDTKAIGQLGLLVRGNGIPGREPSTSLDLGTKTVVPTPSKICQMH